MECIPAIDLRQGRFVRLRRGDFDAETVYGDPLEQALLYEAAGASRLHLVDLDAARDGRSANGALVGAIVAALDIPVQIGGGVRSLEAADALFGIGAARVVVGTAAIEDPGLLEELTDRYPGRVAVGVDHRLVERGVREVAVRGWEVGSGVELEAALDRLNGVDLAALIVTDIGRDGTLDGPDLDGLTLALRSSRHRVIASGGVADPADLSALRDLVVSGRCLDGAIVGTALASGRLSLEEAVRACAA